MYISFVGIGYRKDHLQLKLATLTTSPVAKPRYAGITERPATALPRRCGFVRNLSATIASYLSKTSFDLSGKNYRNRVESQGRMETNFNSSDYFQSCADDNRK